MKPDTDSDVRREWIATIKALKRASKRTGQKARDDMQEGSDRLVVLKDRWRDIERRKAQGEPTDTTHTDFVQQKIREVAITYGIPVKISVFEGPKDSSEIALWWFVKMQYSGDSIKDDDWKKFCGKVLSKINKRRRVISQECVSGASSNEAITNSLDSSVRPYNSEDNFKYRRQLQIGNVMPRMTPISWPDNKGNMPYMAWAIDPLIWGGPS